MLTASASALSLITEPETITAKVHMRTRPVLTVPILVCLSIAARTPPGVARAQGHVVPSLPSSDKLFCETGRRMTASSWSRLRGHVGGVTLLGVQSLTEAEAHILASVRGDLCVEVNSLSPTVAEILCSKRGHLTLARLAKVDGALSTILGSHHGSLGLPDCHDLPPDSLRALMTNNRDGLWIGGMRLTNEQALVLARFGGRLGFGPLSLLDENAAKSLMTYRGSLTLNIVELAPAAAKALAQGDSRFTYGIGVEGGPVLVTEQMAADLSAHAGILCLGNVRFAPSREAVLASLSQRQGALRIVLPPGEPLTVKEAKALSRERGATGATTHGPCPQEAGINGCGDLSLIGNVEYSGEVAEALARRSHGKLSIELHNRLSEELAVALASHRGPLALTDSSDRYGKGRPSTDAVAALCAHSGSLDLPGQWIRPDTIDGVVSHVGGLTVHIPGSFTLSGTLSITEGVNAKSEETWEWMRGDLLARLAAYSGPLHIEGEMTDDVVKALASHSSDLAIDRLPRGKAGLDMLLRRKGRIFLTKSVDIDSVDAAEFFASPSNQTAVCTSSHLIGPTAKEIATILIKRQGSISFPYLKYIKADALQVLASKADVRLLPLRSVFILSDHGLDVEPKQVVSESFLKSNADNQPPQKIPMWHSWDQL